MNTLLAFIFAVVILAFALQLVTYALIGGWMVWRYAKHLSIPEIRRRLQRK